VIACTPEIMPELPSLGSDGVRAAVVARIAAAYAAQASSGTQSAARPIFELAFFGRPQVRFLPPGAPARVVSWRLHRSLDLLAFLALAPGHWASRDALALALWPETEEATLRRNFHPTISDTRRALARAAGRRLDTVVLERDGYGLSEAVAWQIDAERFQREAEALALLRADQPAAALAIGVRAWRRYRGPLLPGNPQAWADAARAALERRYHRLLVETARAAMEVGALGQALDAYRTLLVEDPYVESAHLALMEIYARERRPDLVRRQFMRLEDCLRDLDIEPAEETRARYLDLVAPVVGARAG